MLFYSSTFSFVPFLLVHSQRQNTPDHIWREKEKQLKRLSHIDKMCEWKMRKWTKFHSFDVCTLFPTIILSLQIQSHLRKSSISLLQSKNMSTYKIKTEFWFWYQSGGENHECLSCFFFRFFCVFGAISYFSVNETFAFPSPSLLFWEKKNKGGFSVAYCSCAMADIFWCDCVFCVFVYVENECFFMHLSEMLSSLLPFMFMSIVMFTIYALKILYLWPTVWNSRIEYIALYYRPVINCIKM